jgi:hypothetical protein
LGAFIPGCRGCFRRWRRFVSATRGHAANQQDHDHGNIPKTSHDFYAPLSAFAGLLTAKLLLLFLQAHRSFPCINQVVPDLCVSSTQP